MTQKNKTQKNKTRKNKTKKPKTKKNIFKKNDYFSGDGFLTSVWGPSMWHSLHTISFNYPVEPTTTDKRNYRQFILSLQHTLPCKHCRKNLKTNLKQMPLTMKIMSNRDTFSRYIYNLHELVNKMLHKKSNLTYCEIREQYEHFRSRCTNTKPIIFKYSKINKNKNKTHKKENGCTEPLYGEKSKCIIKIVPHSNKGKTMQIDKKCIKSSTPLK